MTIGSKEKARAYLKTALKATIVQQGYYDTSTAHAELLMDAMDAGIQIVAYDCRNWLSVEPNVSAYIAEFYNSMAAKRGVTADAVGHHMRTDDRFIEELPQKPPATRWDWYAGEMQWLREISPEYASRMAAIESLTELGRQKINDHKLTSDGLAAVVFNAIAKPSGNRLTIGGVNHINGIGELDAKRRPIQHVHGTFYHHLFAVGQDPATQRSHNVTAAVVATAAVAKKIDEQAQHLLSRPLHKAAPVAQLEFLNLDTNEVNSLVHSPADGSKSVSLEEKFLPSNFGGETSLPSAQSGGSLENHVKCHINPLLMPDIKAAADAVREAMNGPEQGRPR